MKNLTVYGESLGVDASGIASRVKYAEISSCTSYVKVSATSGYSGGIGGNVYEGVTIDHCVSYGKIASVGRVGGLAGELAANSTISDSINKGDVQCLDTGGNSVGGVVGSLSGTLLRCANYGNVDAWGRSIGGIAGQSVSTKAVITDCYNVGAVSYDQGTTNTDALGGIIGFGSFYNIKNTFNYGKVEAKKTLTGNNIGGIIGREGEASSSATSNVYYLDTSCAYAESGLKYSELPKTTYTAGMKCATSGDFSKTSGVLSAINGNKAFVLVNSSYPEFSTAASLHQHSGGKATCSTYAICGTCGLEYGSFNASNHSDVITINTSEAIWTTNGYTGDRWCRACDTVLEKGKTIPADTSRKALTVNYVQEGKTILSKTYTVGDLDSLKATSPTLGYSYGANATEIMAAKEYVTLEKLLGASGYNYKNMESVIVTCDGSTSTISAETLQECNKYYDAKGNVYDAPAALCFNYTSLAGSLETVEAECKPNNSIRFGYGISEKQYKEKADVGGKRLVSPVTSLTINLKKTTGVKISGKIGGYAESEYLTISLTRKSQSKSEYTVSAKGDYTIMDVQPGVYIMSVSAGGDYVTREYEITVNDKAVKQDVAIYQLGDVDMNGKIDGDDVLLVAKHVAKIKFITDEYALLLANADRNGKLDAADLTHLARYVAKVISKL